MNTNPVRPANGDSVNVALMKAMGSKSGASDPIPPRQYEAFAEDTTERPRLRVWSAILSRTIHGEPELQRSHIAREHKTGNVTKQINIAAELQLQESEVSACLAELEKEGRIRREGGKIILCAEVPKPVKQDEKAKKQRTEVHCTVNLNEAEEEFLKQLQQMDDSRFQASALVLVVAEEWGMKLQADAAAWARDRKKEAREQVFTEIGYTNSEKRGAPKTREKTSDSSLKPAVSMEKFTVQRTVEIQKKGIRFTVQDGKLTVYEIAANSVQTPHPYRPEVQSSESQQAFQGKANAKPETSEAELKREQARAEIKTEVNNRLRTAKLMSLGAVAIDAGTLNTLANELIRLRTAGEVKDVLDVLEDRAREIKSGKRIAQGWGYLVNTVRGEVDKRLPADLKTQLKAAAAGKGML